MKAEIGSEFWDRNIMHPFDPVWNRYAPYTRLYMSGRGALYAVIEDILSYRVCKRAYLPSYCCDSMAEPFYRHGIEVSFYEVTTQNGIRLHTDKDFSCDIVLTADYFGFTQKKTDLPDAIHIHDVTHSLLRESTYEDADYYVGSLRKWGAVSGAGFAAKRNEDFVTAIPETINEKYLALRREGYALKEQYMNNSEGDKQIFLNIFSEAEELLDKDYAGYCPDEQSVLTAGQISYTKNKRKENAELIYDGLKDSNIVEFLFPDITEEDVPLFVPILVKYGLRNELRTYLIQNRVYCPVHWPVHNNSNGELYERELSLICDQRYDSEDIQRQIDLIRSFEESKK